MQTAKCNNTLQSLSQYLQPFFLNVNVIIKTYHEIKYENPGFMLMCRLHHEVQRDKLNSDQAEAHGLQILTYNIH